MPSDEDFSQLFAQLISRCAKDIDTLVDSLPCEESSPELQNQSLKVLETENQQSAEKLDEVMESAMKLLKKIQDALEDIAQAQLNMQITFKNSK
uniref:Mediator of RNA polymerase II transcription subunit 21 n=1 Tax=Megaselia scalaris TaxID=36166 RepID=T1GK21_MEGSC